MPGPLESEAALAAFVEKQIEQSRVAVLVRQLQAGSVPAPIAASVAAPSSLFVDSADGKLKFKDSAGTVQLLY
jgi:hypothetical protein